MEYLISIVCLFIVFIFVGGLHIYTMKKIDKVQMSLLRGSKEWKDLDNCSMACVYTALMLFLFSTLIGVALHKFVMFEILMYSIGK